MALDDEETLRSSADIYVAPKPRPASPHVAFFEKKYRAQYKDKVNEYPSSHSVLNPQDTLPAGFKWGSPMTKKSSTMSLEAAGGGDQKSICEPPKMVICRSCPLCCIFKTSYVTSISFFSLQLLAFTVPATDNRLKKMMSGNDSGGGNGGGGVCSIDNSLIFQQQQQLLCYSYFSKCKH